MPPSLPTATPRDRLIGIALICGALLCFSCLDATAKWLGKELHPLQIVWARYAASVAIVTMFINPVTRPGVWRTSRPVLQILRSLLLLASTALNFIAVQYLQLAETISIMFMTPFVVALLSVPMLGEWIGPRRLIAIGVGFLGVMLVLRPGLGGLHPAAFLSVIGVGCYALYNIVTRMLAATDSSETTMVYSGLAGVLVVTPLLPLVWVTPSSLSGWLLMILIGGFGAIGHWLLILAHRKASPAILAPFIYTQLIWMVALGWWLFDQWPDRWTFIGGGIVILSGLYLLYRERVRKVEPTPAA